MLFIEGRYVVTMDSQRRIMKHGAVVCEEDKIVDVGPADELKKKYQPKEILGGDRFVILPGLVNTHTHLAMSLIRGIGDDMSLMEMNKRIFFPVERIMQPEDSYWGALLSLVELVKNGVTTTLDIYLHEDKVAEAVEKIGTRAVLAPAMMDTWPGKEEAPLRSTDEVLNEAVSIFKKCHNMANGRVKIWFGPYTELLASPELMKRSAELANEFGTGVHIHLAETHEGQEIVRRLRGKRIFEYVEGTGLFKAPVLAAHCCWLSESDIRVMKKYNVKVSHCPTTEMKISDGVTPVPRLLSEGIVVSLGVDAASANNSQDLIREAKQVSLLHKVTYPLDPELVPAEKALEMITVDAAKCLLWEKEIGSIEPGKKADLILIDLRKPWLYPIVEKPKLNVINDIIYSGSGNDVDTVIVDGKIIVQNRKVLTVDEEEVLEKAQKVTESLLERSGVVNEQIPWRWSI